MTLVAVVTTGENFAYNCWGNQTGVSKNKTPILGKASPSIIAGDHCFRFSRNIAYVTPKNIYFYYQKNYLYDQSIQKIKNFNYEKSFTDEL